jgi:hypothetical protein
MTISCKDAREIGFGFGCKLTADSCPLKKATKASRSSDRCSLRGSMFMNQCPPLMAALMFVGVMAFVVGVLVAMDGGLVAVFLAVVAMGYRPVGVFVFMLVFAVATHLVSPPGYGNILTRLALLSNQNEKNLVGNCF